MSCGLSVSLVLYHLTRRLSGAVVKNPRSGEGVGDGEWGGLLAPDPHSAVHSLCEPGQVNQPLFALLSSSVNEDNKSTYLRVFVKIQ